MFGSEDTSYKGQESSAFRKTKDYYKACMDLDRTGLLGAQPLIDVSTAIRFATNSGLAFAVFLLTASSTLEQN